MSGKLENSFHILMWKMHSRGGNSWRLF